MIFSAVLIGLLVLLAARATRPAPNRYPESMTAVLDPADEEYLAWLADYHWPGDEYLDHLDSALNCPRCDRLDDDVWPCRTCGRVLHAECGLGMRRRPVKQRYRTRDMPGSEAVVAEWICIDCSSVVGLDID
ncbi:hypothetical protein DPM19_34115 [Actinomadura craniellae]|uniref:Uncharacterized protein n=1 Tax=Actinomadura craniellae TaxID=2231787 RepID=A0A365GXN9_9ACTN|nr:hypothetical protein [Actinomadura craniellae]RAY10693.1 hypothetical protein DPM19_34115 [Actinomadura craniellae]